ncbi:MAG: PIN domain-containing protein [Akkermansiaceae bacterium]|nr:PIN domain-containing protein [Akkermansiaceae bacterium]
MRSFVDTNILLYAVSHDPVEIAKSRAARILLATGKFHLSVQVLSEFIANAVKLHKLGMSRKEAGLYAQTWSEEYEVHPLTEEHLGLARAWFEPGKLSWWDSLIVASANLADCETIYSEDLNAGQIYGAAKVVNPFANS